jgi:hypothetical protein
MRIGCIVREGNSGADFLPVEVREDYARGIWQNLDDGGSFQEALVTIPAHEFGKFRETSEALDAQDGVPQGPTTEVHGRRKFRLHVIPG